MSGGANINREVNIEHLPALVPKNPQKVNFNAVSAESVAFDSSSTCIRIFPTQDCYIKISTGSPTATTNDVFCPGGVIQYFGVMPNGIYKIAVIRDIYDGILHIIEGL